MRIITGATGTPHIERPLTPIETEWLEANGQLYVKKEAADGPRLVWILAAIAVALLGAAVGFLAGRI